MSRSRICRYGRFSNYCRLAVKTRKKKKIESGVAAGEREREREGKGEKEGLIDGKQHTSAYLGSDSGSALVGDFSIVDVAVAVASSSSPSSSG